MAKLSKKIEELVEQKNKLNAEIDYELRREITDILYETGELDDEDADLGVEPTEKYIDINVSDFENGELDELRVDVMTGDVWVTDVDSGKRIELYELCIETLIEILNQI